LLAQDKFLHFRLPIANSGRALKRTFEAGFELSIAMLNSGRNLAQSHKYKISSNSAVAGRRVRQTTAYKAEEAQDLTKGFFARLQKCATRRINVR